MALTKISTAMISQSAAAVDLNVDAGTFYVDTTNNRVGVGGKTDPDTPLHVIGTVTATLFAGSGASLTNIPNSALTNSSITINSTATSLGGSITLGTDDVAEGSSNLYYTNARADARIAAADTDDLSEGSSNLYYTDARVDARISGGSLGNITTTGYIRGPSSFTIDPAAHGDNTGTVVIAGNLQVDGVTTTINSTTLTVDDKNITLASGSANAAAASGAGFTVDIGSGTNPAITYDGTNDEWDFNKPTHVEVAGSRVAEFGRTGAGTFDLTISDVGVGAAQLWFQAQTNDTGFNFRPKSSSGTNTNALYIAPDGKVGIGTSSPADRLHISGGNILLNNALEIRTKDTGGTIRTVLRANSSNELEYGWSANAPVKFMGGGSYTERMRIHTNGYVGIGTSSPQRNLDVRHGLNIFGSGGYTELMLRGRAGTAQNLGAWHWSIRGDVGGSNDDLMLLRFTGGNSPSYAGTSMHIRNDNGYVGIGTNTGQPSAHLHVKDATGEAKVLIQAGSNTSSAVLQFGDSLDTSRGGIEYTSTDDMAFSTNNMTEAMRIRYTGNVGIGTTAPNAKLTVNVTGNNDVLVLTRDTGTNGSLEIDFDGAFTNFNSTQGGFDFSYAGSSPIVRMDYSGNVGIGTTSPNQLLEIQDSTPGLRIHANDLNAAPNPKIELMRGTSSTFGGDAYTDWRLECQNDARFRITSHDSSYGENVRFIIKHDNGNVGIGNTNPQHKIHFGEGGGYYTSIGSGNSVPGGATPWLGVFNNTSIASATYGWGFYDSSADGSLQIWNRDSSTTGAVALTIKRGGNVGIGTDSPGYPLEISGAGTVSLAYQRTGTGVTARKWGFHSDNSNTYWQNITDNLLAVTVSNAGNVGIGTTSPTTPLSIRKVHATGYGSGIDMLDFKAYYPPNYDTETSKASIFVGTSDKHTLNTHGGYLAFKVNSSGYNGANGATSLVEYMRIEKDGNVGIGTTSPGRALEVSTDGTSQFRLSRVDSTINGNNTIGTIEFWGTDDTSGTIGATIVAHAASTWGGGAYPTDLRFSTMDGSTLSEQMRITRLGDVSIGSNHGGFSGWKVLNIRQNSTGGMVNFEEDDGTRAFTFANQGVGMRYQAHITGGYHRFETHALGAGTAMMITDAGNVGIGTASPDDGKLQISANSSSDWGTYIYNTNASGLGLHVETNSYGTEQLLRLSSLTGSGGSNIVRMVVRADGKVGIGTTSPTSKLEVIVTQSDTMTDDTAAFAIKGNGGDGILMGQRATAPYAAWIAAGYLPNIGTSHNYPLTLQPHGGNVGIGTTDPLVKLDVKGSPSAPANSGTAQTGSLRVSQTAGNGVLDMGFYTSSNGTAWLQSTNKTNLATNYDIALQPNGGNVGIGTTSPGTPLTVNGGTESFSLEISETQRMTMGADGTWNYIKAKSGQGFRFSTTGAGDVLALTNGGNVGIGTTSPNSRLHVDHSISSTAANIAESKSVATISVSPLRNGSAYGMYFGNDGTNTGYVQVTDGTNASSMNINPFGGSVGIGTTSPDSSASMGGQTPILTVDGYTSLDGLRISGSDSGNTIYKSGSALSVVSSTHAVNVKGNTQVNLQAGSNEMFRAAVNKWSLGGGSYGHGRIRSYHHVVSLSANATIALLQNQSAHTDVNFIYWIEAFHSSRSYRTGMGTFGGYGMHKSSASNGGLDIYGTNISSGIQRLDIRANSSFSTTYHISMLIFGDSGITVHNGTMSDQI